jgi:hypothetical protein
MRFILLLICTWIWLSTTGCLMWGGHDGEREHDEHSGGVDHGEHPGDNDHGDTQQR